jgi:hypothetical protein
VVRAEACARDFYSALDVAISKLDTRLRRAADRRRVHRGRHAPVSVAEATAGLPTTWPHRPPSSDDLAAANAAKAGGGGVATAIEQMEQDDQPWHVVREKEHPADPMTLDDALFEMELVGHDFYLFLDKETRQPSVVYRRKGYDYGIISLATGE